MHFKKWLTENATTPGSRRGLYPDAYSAVVFYPPSAVINWSADAITYMSEKDRKYTGDDSRLEKIFKDKIKYKYS